MRCDYCGKRIGIIKQLFMRNKFCRTREMEKDRCVYARFYCNQKSMQNSAIEMKAMI